MTDSPADSRRDALAAWLSACAPRYGLDVSTLAPASADASFRRYFRLASACEHGASLIAVDAPPPEKCREFAQVAHMLADAGVHVPRVLESDLNAGFMLVTDLGTRSYIAELDSDDTVRAKPLMRDAVDALIRWQSASREGVLPPFDEAFLRREMELMPEWYVARHIGREVDDNMRGVLDRTYALLIASARAQPQVFMLRDFMPRNLMICEPNPGVLDFQDAVYGPVTYDLVSLLRDAYIEWEEERQIDWAARYWERARRAGLPVNPDVDAFYRDFEFMGLQRHIKVLGIFARLYHRDGKDAYLKDMPLVMEYTRKAAGRYTQLAPLIRLLDDIEGKGDSVGYTF